MRECGQVTRESLFLALLGGLLTDPEMGKISLTTIQTSEIERLSAEIIQTNTGVMSWVITIGHMETFRAKIFSPFSIEKNLVFRVRYGIGEEALFFVTTDHIKKTGEKTFEVSRPIELTSKTVWQTNVKVQVELCWKFDQTCFLGETHSNPRKGIGF